MGFDFTKERLQDGASHLCLLMDEGVLSKRNRDKFPGREGTLNFICADGDQFFDVVGQHQDVCHGRSCCHTFATNGGPLRIALGSPVAHPCENEMWLNDAVTAFKIKRLDTVIILHHWPCGLADGNDLSIETQFELCANGKSQLRTALNQAGFQPEVVLNVRVDANPLGVPTGTYHFDRHMWANLMQKRQSSARMQEREFASAEA